MKLSNTPYIKHWKTPTEQLKKEVEDIAKEIDALLDSKKTALNGTIKEFIKDEYENILSTSYNGVGMSLTKVFGTHQTNVNRFEGLKQNITTLSNIFKSLNILSNTIKSIEQGKETGNGEDSYPYHNYRSAIQQSDLLYGKNPNPTLYPNYNDRIAKYISGIQYKITNLITDLNQHISANIEPKQDVIENIEAATTYLNTNKEQRKEFIKSLSPKRGSSESLAIQLSRYGLR